MDGLDLAFDLTEAAKTQLVYNSQPSSDRDKKGLRYILGIGWTF